MKPGQAGTRASGLRYLRAAWRNAKEFSGFTAGPAGTGDRATLLWPRWLVLRAVGLVYVFIFAGIAVEGRALVGPFGVAPLASYFAQLRQLEPGTLAAFFKAPSLFWLGTSATMVTALAWCGLLAATALVLNWWPRLALVVCWLVFLSFVASWGEFSPAQLDGLMLEVALLCIPFAPRGLRPGLGASSPPRPIAVFMMRWMLFRVMAESGIVKLLSADPHWRQLTAMDVMYETSPSPTVLGFWAHQLPHGYHVFEIAFTFAAELVAPALAVFGGRRGRWVALGLWTLLQAGIQLTCNFGWLNTAAFALGLLLLDDGMIFAAAEKLRLPRLRRWLVERVVPAAFPVCPEWKIHGLRVALGVHFSLTVYYFAQASGVPVDLAPSVVRRPVDFLAEFRSANRYHLYANFEQAHFQVDLEGSNDAGKTWRTYELRYLPQAVDRMSPFTAPYFARFETTLQIESSRVRPTSVFQLVAAHLLARTPEVITLFRTDPFPDRPPTVVRMRLYRMTLVDRDTHRSTGRYWQKEFAGDYLPAMYLGERGGFASFDLKEADAAVARGDVRRALALYEQQYGLGNLDAGYRIADLLTRGEGIPAQPARVAAIFSDLAERGEVKGVHNLGLCYEHGIGVPVNFQKAVELYRAAAARGNLASVYALGVFAAEDRLVPRDDVEGLAFLLRAAQRSTGDDPLSRFIREEGPAQTKRLMERMPAADVAKARRRARAGL